MVMDCGISLLIEILKLVIYELSFSNKDKFIAQGKERVFSSNRTKDDIILEFQIT